MNYVAKSVTHAALWVPVALCWLSGCGDKSGTAAVPPGQELKNRPVDTSTPPPPVRSSTLVIRGPHPAADVVNLYSRPSMSVTPLAERSFPPEKVSGEADWDVKIAREWRYIIIHHSASSTGSADAFNRWHIERGWDGLGYDFVIGNGHGSSDGQVEVGYRWVSQVRGAHAGVMEYNEHGIGICLVGDLMQSPPTERQMASLTRLVRFLQGKCSIPTSEVWGHNHCKPTECPGKYFDLAAFRATLNGGVPVPLAVAVRASSRPPALHVARGGATTMQSGAAVP